jgi:hypothetical protein
MRTNDNGIDRDMTEDELANYEISSSIYLAKAKAETEAAQAKEIAKAALLERLGITAEEAALLLG